MICNYMVRMGMPLTDAVRHFAVHRPPGIYKDDYIQALFKYNHFYRCAAPTANQSVPDSWREAPLAYCSLHRARYMAHVSAVYTSEDSHALEMKNEV